MSLHEFSSASPDAILIAASLLMVALVITARAKSKVSLPALIAVVLAGTLIAATKPPYLPLALAALAALWWAGPRPAKVNLMFAAALIVMVSVPVLWLKLSNAGTVNYNAQFQTDAAAQSAFLLSHPFAVAELAFSTLRILGKAYWVQMIGILGWQDAPLHPAAVSILGFGLIAILALDGTSAKPLRWVFLVAGAASVALVFASLYVAWNSLFSRGPILGVQGRYFLPILPFWGVPGAEVRQVRSGSTQVVDLHAMRAHWRRRHGGNHLAPVLFVGHECLSLRLWTGVPNRGPRRA